MLAKDALTVLHNGIMHICFGNCVYVCSRSQTCDGKVLVCMGCYFIMVNVSLVGVQVKVHVYSVKVLRNYYV